MNINRDELLLLSRGGRMPRAARARPDPEYVSSDSRRPPARLARPGLRVALAGWSAMLADVLRGGVADDGRGRPRPVAAEAAEAAEADEADEAAEAVAPVQHA